MSIFDFGESPIINDEYLNSVTMRPGNRYSYWYYWGGNDFDHKYHGCKMVVVRAKGKYHVWYQFASHYMAEKSYFFKSNPTIFEFELLMQNLKYKVDNTTVFPNVGD